MKAWPKLTHMVSQFINEHADTGFTYTFVQMNKDYICFLHIDTNNEMSNASYIIGLSDYTEGELWVFDPQRKMPIRVNKKIRGAPGVAIGSVLKGKLLDLKTCTIETVMVKVFSSSS